MNLRISDLLNDWADDTVELPFPSDVSPDHIRTQTLARAQTPPKPQPKPKRRRVSLLLCAALAAALCVSAAAYQLLGPGELLDSFFTLESAPLNATQKETLDEIGATQLPPSVSNGVTLTPLAAAMDERTLYLRLRVEAPEGTVLPDMQEREDYAFLDFDILYTDTGKRGGTAMQKARWLADDVPGDNVAEFVFILYGDIDTNLLDGESYTVYVRNLLFNPGDDEDYVLLEGEWSFPLSFFSQSQEVTVDTAGATRWDEETQCTLQLDELRITPLSAVFRISYPDGGAPQFPPEAGIEVVLTDGTVLTVLYGMGTSGAQGCNGSYAFDTPVPLEDIAYIRFGNYKLTLPQANA